MLTADILELQALQTELGNIKSGHALADVREIFRQQLDSLRPAEDLSTNEVANKYRWLPTEGGGKRKFLTSDIPYVEGIHDALDDPTKRIVLVKGPARSVKTTAAENHLLKIGKFGPSRNVLWYMHSTSDLEDYVEERGEFFMSHEGLREKIGKTPRENSRLRKKVDGKIWRWLAANKSTTRGKAAPYIVVDEVDAMRKEIRRAIKTLVRNRQREFGNMAKAYIASHSDEGPLEGIDALLVDSDLRVRMWRCKECGGLASPAVEAPGPSADAPRGRRIVWNMADLMQAAAGMARDDLLDFVAKHVLLHCPHCGVEIDNEARLELDRTGVWFGKGQEIVDEQIVGEMIDTDTAGFVIHAFMSGLVTLAGLAREWAAAKLDADETGNTAGLKEVMVKSLGETYRRDIAAAKPKDWKTIRSKLMDTGYRLNTVPRGVDFLTAFVDVGGGKFDCGVIGWNRFRESWLIARFTITDWQRPGDAAPRAINPGDSVLDWGVLEDRLIHRDFPLNDGSGRRMMIAKVGIDTGGAPGVTNNARIWAANIMARAEDPIPSWRIALLKGQGALKPEKDDKKRKPQTELYTRRRTIEYDDAERQLALPVLERTVYTDEVKLILSTRMMDLETPGPGWMHLPSDVDDRHVRELVAETYEAEMWIRRGANELWDIWVACEVLRSLLAPDSEEIDWDHPPFWASPFLPDDVDDNEPEQDTSFVGRLTALNKGKAQREEY